MPSNSERNTPHTSFEKQRDQLVHEVIAAMDSVVYNIDILNRSLNDSIQVGKVFQDSSKLWANFYNGSKAETTSNDMPTEPIKDQSVPAETVESSENAKNDEVREDPTNIQASEMQVPRSNATEGQENIEQTRHAVPTEREASEQTAETFEKLQPETNDTD